MNKARILIIEDDEEMCEELTKILEDENYFVNAAYDGEKGTRFIEENDYDIILLDLKMPRINGYKVLEYIKRRSVNTKVLVLTGSPISKKVLQEEGEELLRKNEHEDTVLKLANGVINKPFDIDRVLSKIKELVEKRRRP